MSTALAERTGDDWFRRSFQSTPWTLLIIIANVVTWLFVFFGANTPSTFLAGELGLTTAWRWLTYPLVGGGDIVPFLLFMYVFWWIGTSLERSWGSAKFARVFVVATLAYAAALWLGFAVMQRSYNPQAFVGGLLGPETTLFCIWAALNQQATVLFMFIVPVQAKWLALGVLVLHYFQMGPIMGLFAISVPILGWVWATRSHRAAAPGPSSKRSLLQWWKDRKREKQKSKLKPIEGGRGLGISGVEPGARPKLRSTVVGEIEESSSEAELNRILDKINAEGMDALTEAERETLDSRSRRLRDND